MFNSKEPKKIGMICRLVEQPSGVVVGFIKKPIEIKTQRNDWVKTLGYLKSKQNVILVESNNSADMGNRYYKVIASEGLWWIHHFDLIDVDPETGEIVPHVVNIILK